ncbi:MAG TPA: ATP-binding protein [Flavilitoribacter sp.]|nr:ATP-binding protein [Flavilitoribacter sp.]HMQ86350.1 ATP-binding protein [Flavilitoribacter sp.]
MKHRYILFFLSIALTFTTVSGRQTIAEQLKTATGRERVDLLNADVEQLRFTDAETAKKRAEEALKLSKKLNYQQGIAKSSLYLGIKARDDKSYQKSGNYLEEAAEAAQAAGDRNLELTAWKVLEQVARIKGWNNSLAEAELHIKKLENGIALDAKSAEYEQLKTDFDSKEGALNRSMTENQAIRRTLNMTREEILVQEAELARIGQQKAELETKAAQLEAESARNALEASEKEKELLQINDRLRRQRLVQLVLFIGLGAAVIIIFLLYRFYRLKRIRAEEKIQAQRQLLQQEKMATLGQLTAGIAHEIKNPLNFVNNFAEGSSEMAQDLKDALNKTGSSPGEQELAMELAEDLRQNAAYILHHGKRADRIINSMMEHARGDRGAPQQVDLNLLVEDSVNLSYHGYRALHPTFNIDLQLSLAQSLPRAEIVPQDLSRVLLNILNNACYALHQKFKEKGEAFAPVLSVKTERTADDLVIRIRDNGPGIPEAIRNKVFNPFFTTKPTGEGNAGLGLSISYDVVVQGMNGKIDFKSKEGEFTEFEIRVPLGKG